SGQYVAIFKEQVNRDATRFGADAADFDPGRVAPVGVYSFGLGFGSGAHMCIGLPVVLGNGAIPGIQVPMLEALYKVGLTPDPERQRTREREIDETRDEFATFPVQVKSP